MRRLIATVAAAALSALASLALAQPQARVPERVFLISPEDRPEPAAVLSAAKPVTHQTLHVATTWGAQLFQYLNVGPDCRPTDVAITVVTPPSHGSLFLNQATLPPFKVYAAAFPKGDPRAACQSLSARGAHYLPDDSYIGRVQVVVSFQEGDATFTDKIDVIVHRAAHPSPLRPAG